MSDNCSWHMATNLLSVDEVLRIAELYLRGGYESEFKRTMDLLFPKVSSVEDNPK